MIRWIGLSLVAAASAAGAQQQTQTNCRTDQWGNTNCTTTQSPGINWDILKKPPPTYTPPPMDWGSAIASEQEAKRRKKAESQVAEVSRLLLAGDCAGAERYALTVGNIPLAQQAKDYCAK